jgi:hypothetical protein
MRSAASDVERFDIAKDVDARLQRHLDYCPSLKPSSEPYPANISINDDFDYLPCARYTLVLRLAGMRIQLYGRFYTRSYRDFRFQEARQVRYLMQRIRPRSRLTFRIQNCLAAARTALRELRKPVPHLYRAPW